MIVSVSALFSCSPKLGAKIISKSTAHLAPGLPLVSHTALLIQDRWVHEATGSGVSVCSYDKWSLKHAEVARVSLAPKEYGEIADKFRVIRGKKYDYLGLFYLGFWVFLSFFGATIPVKNLLESRKKYFCCEAVAYLTGCNYSMCTPNQILSRLRKK
jgi:hypothetical protein